MAILTDAHQAKLRRSLKLHVIVALLTTMVLIVVNLVTTPRYPWWMWVAV
ncbi:MAG: 2TM domain-containing protein, partial [Alphaproteobacteria bacterium]|nr:2TM domain-containing protein [Alphaproteobacteria bacterium]